MKTPTTPYEALLLASAITILKSEPDRGREPIMNTISDPLDSDKGTCFNQDLDFFNPPQENTMAKRPSKAEQAAIAASAQTELGSDIAGTPEANTVIEHEDGTTETLNPTTPKEPTKQELKAVEALAKIAAKAAKMEAAAAAKAEREAAKEAKLAESGKTKEERAAAKVEREARLAELGKNYKGSMLALADRVKQGVYIKGTTGQLRSNDELAQALDGVTPLNVVQLAKALLGVDENPYSALNIGQQSMNFRNRLRGAIKKGTVTIAAVSEYVAANDLDASGAIKAKAEAKAIRAAEMAAARDAKAAAAEAKAAAKHEKEAATAE